MRGFWIFCVMLAGAEALTLAATACATHPAAAITTTCLPLKTYSPAEQKALAEQLATIPKGSPLDLAMQDYGAMRDADRACRK